MSSENSGPSAESFRQTTAASWLRGVAFAGVTALLSFLLARRIWSPELSVIVFWKVWAVAFLNEAAWVFLMGSAFQNLLFTTAHTQVLTFIFLGIKLSCFGLLGYVMILYLNVDSRSVVTAILSSIVGLVGWLILERKLTSNESGEKVI